MVVVSKATSAPTSAHATAPYRVVIMYVFVDVILAVPTAIPDVAGVPFRTFSNRAKRHPTAGMVKTSDKAVRIVTPRSTFAVRKDLRKSAAAARTAASMVVAVATAGSTSPCVRSAMPPTTLVEGKLETRGRITSAGS